MAGSGCRRGVGVPRRHHQVLAMPCSMWAKLLTSKSSGVLRGRPPAFRTFGVSGNINSAAASDGTFKVQTTASAEQSPHQLK